MPIEFSSRPFDVIRPSSADIPSPHPKQRSHRLSVDDLDTVDGGYWPRAMELRLLIAASYVALSRTGLLPMSTTWWIASAWSLFAYAAAALALHARFGITRWYQIISPYSDGLMVTLAIVALARPDYPIWIGYLLVISSLAAVHTTRYIVAFSFWLVGLYWGGLWVLDATGRAPVTWSIAMIVSIMLVFAALNEDLISSSNRRLRDIVRKASLTDPLTGLDNRRRFRDVVESHSADSASPLAVLMYDIDDFKTTNDTLGHVHADTVLVGVADTLRVIFREADTVARYGGDEIAVLAHVLSVDHAIAMAERSLAAIKERTGVTVSIGLAVCPAVAPTIDGALSAADDALRAAKQDGKARISVASAQAA
jgi:diguanylate cyclase (GGDEF)-like protein